MADRFGVFWSATAQADLVSIADYAAREDLAAGLRIIDGLEKAAAALARFPRRGRVVPEFAEVNVTRYREVIRGPWRIVYFVDGRRVGVVAALDSRRDLATLLLERLLR